ncbi:MAG: phosphoenolpyruvate carboxykinase (ATP) [Anaerolineaceae bacterium]|nr:phosphoenolpyruvate carboxykinase (ATP) [Anaerolineaceae bacterium]
MQIVQTHPEMEALGFSNLNQIYWDLHTPQLYEQALRRQEGFISHMGPLVTRTGDHTGRSPKDRFIVEEPTSRDKVWWGEVNVAFSEQQFDALLQKVLAYFQGKNIFVQNMIAGAAPGYRMKVRIINEHAWHNLFARNMFIRATPEESANFTPEFTVIQAPDFHARPEIDGTRSSAFVLLNFARRMVLIGGTSYAGEVKKSIFSVLNYKLPQRNVLPMHCSANIGAGADGETALFFGLSGTGKTTLSADASRILIGDDEHGWSDNGVFNFEGGCYAKVIKLSPTGEPEIYETTRRFGTILENVSMDMNSRRLNLDDDTHTENTRASYPIGHIPNATKTGMGGHPKNVIFLTADAFGVLPPVSRLTPEQAMYHFISGYTAKVAGTEKGVTEPSATFSACFGAPFLPLHPTVYANLLREKLTMHQATVWLVNTGWTGGPYGVGNRMSLAHTRAIINAILDGGLTSIPTTADPIFGLHIPDQVPDVPTSVLNPRNTWGDKEAYDAKARELAERFKQNFKKYADLAGAEVVSAGPII